MFGELTHEGYAEFADLIVGFAFRVKVCTSFAASDVHWEGDSLANEADFDELNEMVMCEGGCQGNEEPGGLNFQKTAT